MGDGLRRGQTLVKPRCLLSGSCPQLLNLPLRTTQHPVDHESVGVGCYLGCDPGSQPNKRGGQSLAQAKDSLEARKSDLYVLPYSTPPLGWLGRQQRMPTSAKASLR